MKNVVFVFIFLVLLSCSSEDGTKPELTNPILENEVSEDLSQRAREWDLVVLDSDGYCLNLNVSGTYYNKIKWTGELVSSYGNEVGPAFAYYDIAKDLFGASGIDNHISGGVDCNYFFEFNGSAMNGAFFYSETYGWAAPINAAIQSGSIGPHQSAPIAADFFNEDPTPRLSGQSIE